MTGSLPALAMVLGSRTASIISPAGTVWVPLTSSHRLDASNLAARRSRPPPCRSGGLPEARITAGNRLTTYRTARSAFPAVVLDHAGPYRESGKTGHEWRDSQAPAGSTPQVPGNWPARHRAASTVRCSACEAHWVADGTDVNEGLHPGTCLAATNTPLDRNFRSAARQHVALFLDRCQRCGPD